MSLKRRLRTFACCGMLEFAALFGMPMRPEQIREFMQTLNEPKLAHVLPSEDEGGDPPEPRTANREARTAKREPRTENREPRTANREGTRMSR